VVNRSQEPSVATLVEAALVLGAFALAAAQTPPYRDVGVTVPITLLGFGMGLQNATARALAVPDLTTTVLTLTITGIPADSTLAGGQVSRVGRRLVGVVSMFLGAFVGVVLIEAGHGALTLLLATMLLVGVTVTAARKSGAKFS
ncbi:DUF1275 domain-containing protein, partial [Georgenia ruanii]|nr:DUF1275 domain-containing protein [Georgenia ruanii]